MGTGLEEQIRCEYDKTIAEMKQQHAKEIEATVDRCAKKEEKISELKRRVRTLEQDNENLTMENENLRYAFNDMNETAAMYAAEALGNDEIPECGYVELTNATCYQDFIGILINNGYTVQVSPVDKGRKLGITIKESEEE